MKFEKSAAILLKRVDVFRPSPSNTMFENQEKLQVVVFNTVCGVGGEVKLVKLYSHLAAYAQKRQKRQKCKFVPS